MSIQACSNPQPAPSSTTTRSSKCAMRTNRPPNALEEAAICSLLAEDDALVSLLESQLALRQTAAEDALATVESLSLECDTAESRLQTAHELYQFFLNTRSNLPSLRVTTPSPPSTPAPLPFTGPHVSTSPSSPKLSAQAYDALLKLTTDYTNATRAAVEESEVALEEARMALRACKDSHQAAITVAHLRKVDVDVLAKQIKALRQASDRKKWMFRTIWKVPEEVWRQIFISLVSSDSMVEAYTDRSGERRWLGRRGGCSALTISVVCHAWRTISHSTPELWNSIFIPNQLSSFDVERVRHYYNLCQKDKLSITISAVSASSETAQLYRHFYGLFDLAIPARITKIYLRSPAVPALNSLLPYLPPPTELHLCRPAAPSTEIESTPAPLVPSSYCATVKVLHIVAAGAQWADEEGMRLDKYTIFAPPPSAIYGPHRFIPSSLSSLRVLGIEGRLVDSQAPRLEDRRVLAQIEEVVMDLEFLATVFVYHYRLPKLKKVSLPKPSTVATGQWDKCLHLLAKDRGVDEAEGLDEVEVLDIKAEEEDHRALVACLARTKTLTSLVLHGESVEPFLRSLLHRMRPTPTRTISGRLRPSSVGSGSSHGTVEVLPALQSLRVVGYQGDGALLAELVEGRRAAGGDVEVALEACRKVSVEARMRLGTAIVAML